MRTGIVIMKKKATESRLRAALVQSFEDLREIVMPVPVRSPSVLRRNGGDMARFSEETGKSFQFWGEGTPPETAKQLTAS